MPWADNGRLLRGRYGQRFPPFNGPQPYSFAYSDNTGVGAPCLVGTPQFLTASRFASRPLDYSPAIFDTGPDTAARFKFWQSSSRPWGKPGTLTRVPRVAVLAVPDIAHDDYDGNDRASLFGRALLNSIGSGVGPLLAAGVSVFVGTPLNTVYLSCPLLGPCFLTGSALFVSGGAVSGAIGYGGLIDHTTDAASAIGGDVWWGAAGGSNHVSFFNYVSEGGQIAFYPTAEDAPSLTVDIPPGFVEYGSDALDDVIGSGLSVAALSKLAIWVEKLRSEEERLLPVIQRCRSFRWRWVMNGWDGDQGAGFTSPSKNCNPSTFVSMMNSGINAGLITGGVADNPTGNGNSAGQQVLSDMMNFFGVS